MNILVLCPHFDPDTAPTGVVMTRLVRELGNRGHRLHVVTALPWYRKHDIEHGWEGSWIRRDADLAALIMWYDSHLDGRLHVELGEPIVDPQAWDAIARRAVHAAAFGD